MPELIKAGDVVKLISGGPKMTVRTISEDGEWADLDWFVGSAHQSGNIKLTSLKPVRERK